MSASSAATGAGTGAAIGSAISPGLGTIIGAGLGLIGGLFGNSSDKSINKQQIEYNKWALAQQERYNWEMWNATNAYNDPLAEKARYARAGINPAVMFKSGLTDQASLGSGIDPEAYNPHPVRTPFDGWMNGYDPISEYQKMIAINKAKVDIENTQMDTHKKESEKNKLDKEKDILDIKEQVAKSEEAIAKIDERYHEEIVKQGIEKEYQQINNLVQAAANASTQNDLMKSEIDLNKALEDVNKWKSTEIRTLMQANLNALIASTKKALADAREANANAYSVELENDIVSSISKDDRIETKKADLRQRIIDAGLSGIQLDQAQSIADILVNEKNTYKIRMWAGILTGLLSAGAAAAKAGAAYK